MEASSQNRWLVACLAAATLLATTGALWQGPWEDEYYSLRGADSIHGYRYIPLYFLWLKVGYAVTHDITWLRLWSFVPFLVGLGFAHRLLRALEAKPRDALITIGCLATNPFLLQECMRVRYYAFFFMTATLALLAFVFLLRGRGSRRQRLLAGLLLLLPQLTIYSSAAMLGLLAIYWVATGRVARRSVPGLLVLLLAVGALTFVKLYPDFRIIVTNHGWAKLLSVLPLDLGYEKPPATIHAIAFQYNKLMGWNYLTWFAPARLVEWSSTAIVAVAMLVFAFSGRARRKGLVILLGLAPVAVWMLAWVINVIGVRYYIYATLPVTFVLVAALGYWWDRRGAPWLRIAPIALGLGLSVASLAISFAVPTNPPLDRLIPILKRHEVRELTVVPMWYASTLDEYLASQGLDIAVTGWGRPDAPAEPRWVFRKYHRYTDSRHGVIHLDASEYEIVGVIRSLKKYYFHDPRTTDRLLRRR